MKKTRNGPEAAIVSDVSLEETMVPTGKPMIPVTKLRQFVECPIPVYHYYVKNLQCESSPSSICGVFEHECRRRILEEMKQIYIAAEYKENDIDQVYTIIRKNVRDIGRTIIEKHWDFRSKIRRFEEDLIVRLEKEEDLRVHRARMLLKEGTTGIDLVEILLPYKTELDIVSNELGLIGRVDAVYRTPTGLVPIDYKTGYFDPSCDLTSSAMQLTAYAMLLECQYRTEVDYGIVYFTRYFLDKPIVVSDRMRADVLNVRNAVIELIETGEVPDAVPTSRCDKCHHRSLCDDCENHHMQSASNDPTQDEGTDFDRMWAERLFNSPKGTFRIFDNSKEVIE